ncbi:MAG: GHKL domain-containing protein [Lachnospiraceae bacterium]
MSVYTVIDGVATCLEILALIFLLQNEEVKGEKTRQIFLFLVLVISLIIMTSLGLNVWVRTAIKLAFTVIVGIFIYLCSPFKLLFYGIIDLLAVILSEEVVIGIWNIYNNTILADNIIYDDFTLSLVIAMKAFYFFIIMLCKKVTSKTKGDRTIKELIPMLCVGIPFLLIFECLNIIMPQIHGETERVFYLICCAAILFAFVYILIFFENHLQMQKKAQKKELALYELQLRYGYYERKKEDEEKVREVYHDLKNHLLLLKDDSTVEYIAHKIEAYESYIETGNEFLDIIISEKVKLAQSRNIQIECDIDFSAGSFIQTLDVSTIFGNLIDNAIEAAEKVYESEKYIFINVEKKAQLIIIVIKNSMVGTFNYGTKTSKSNSSFHGYGLTNVNRAIRKYNGDLDINLNENEFRISIILPIPSGKLKEKEVQNEKY